MRSTVHLGRLLLAAGAIAALSVMAEEPEMANAGGGGTISVQSSAVTGQQDKLLRVTVTPAGAGGPVAEACAQIDQVVFLLYNIVLSDIPPGPPCSGGTPDTVFAPGEYTVTAGVYVPPAQSPEKQVSASVTVDGNEVIILDGVALTADPAGDADCDRDVDTSDMLAVLRVLADAGLPPPCLAAGNLRCTDALDALDALDLLRFVAGLPEQLPAQCPTPLPAPVLVLPANGAVLQIPAGPRIVQFDWGEVPSAAGYTVQVDCFECCADAQYCADVGFFYRLAPNLPGTSYSTELDADNLHHWRAWALDADGRPGSFSDFWTFHTDTTSAIVRPLGRR